MKVIFISNFLTHHQLPFCLEMVERYGDDFKFISTIKIFEERLKLGYKDLDYDYDFVVRAYESEEEYNRVLKLALESDIVIMGSTSDKYLQERLKQDKLTFRYRERIFQNGLKTIFDKEKMKNIYERHLKYKNNKNLYMLCASGYGANDFYKLGVYKDKIYKWGYFPIFNKYNVEKLVEEKEKNEEINILWTSRFIKWKHPEYMVKLANKLRNENYKFKIKMLGNGVEIENIKSAVKEQKLENYIEVVGPVSSDKVREYMEKANIFLFTSDKREGWGAVLNESMNSACAVIANRNIGAVPFLVENGENGLTYETFDEFYELVKKAIDDKNLRKKISINAYNTISTTWNSKKAAENISQLFEDIINNRQVSVKEGPASKALPYKKER